MRIPAGSLPLPTTYTVALAGENNKAQGPQHRNGQKKVLQAGNSLLSHAKGHAENAFRLGTNNNNREKIWASPGKTPGVSQASTTATTTTALSSSYNVDIRRNYNSAQATSSKQKQGRMFRREGPVCGRSFTALKEKGIPAAPCQPR